MSTSSSAVKITAKTSLKGNWISAIASCCILIFSYMIISNSVSILSLVTGDLIAELVLLCFYILILAPLALGLIRFFWRLLFDACDKPTALFYYFSDKHNYKRAIGLIFSLTFKVILWGFFLKIPVFITEILANDSIYEFFKMPIPIWTANLLGIKVFLDVITSVLIGFIMLKYYLAPMLFVADDNIEPAEALLMSLTVSKKTTIDFIYLLASFMGWFLLSLTIVPTIFIFPYFITSYLVHSRFAVAEYNKLIKQINENLYQSYSV